jgi:hypothetical protein
VAAERRGKKTGIIRKNDVRSSRRRRANPSGGHPDQAARRTTGASPGTHAFAMMINRFRIAAITLIGFNILGSILTWAERALNHPERSYGHGQGLLNAANEHFIHTPRRARTSPHVPQRGCHDHDDASPLIPPPTRERPAGVNPPRGNYADRQQPQPSCATTCHDTEKTEASPCMANAERAILYAIASPYESIARDADGRLSPVKRCSA